MFAKVVSKTLSVRSTPATGDNMIATLTEGQVIPLKGLAKNAPRWAVIEHEGREAYVSRRLIAQSIEKPPQQLDAATEALVTKIVWSATGRYDSVTYKLGCKCEAQGAEKLVFSGTDIEGRPCSGSTVDCSGWTAGLFQLLASNLNATYGWIVLPRSALKHLYTHSDGQIAGIGQATRAIYSGPDIDRIELRTGLLLGINNGDYTWEGSDRVFGIDHIVMVVRGPDGYCITQSSSGGGGVNIAPWPAWREQVTSKFAGWNVHCVDPLALGVWSKAAAETRGLEPDRDPGLDRSPLSAEAG
jgi:hypothetical protein